MSQLREGRIGWNQATLILIKLQLEFIAIWCDFASKGRKENV
ncbi:hypothetical protein [Legionella pneumophila]|nr:hypothetical protein [Legionella pneumophila]ABQ54207.1 hypothetical protein LPC_0209 [Legionella pneumophila str. Corby]CZH77492.1 Uncharacterised protein [Legionella pneumophila]CZH84282.1 Uncharacterised protein [Legionella pneumophila]CZH87241.1 Uncharacterised protein [Legionella pneumophila]CZI02562.1 Uncharacterised protein [Legionella pneumophila]